MPCLLAPPTQGCADATDETETAGERLGTASTSRVSLPHHRGKTLSPDIVASARHVQAVGDEQLGPRPTIGAEHRREHVHVGLRAVARDFLAHETVRLAYGAHQRPAAPARPDRDENESRRGEL